MAKINIPQDLENMPPEQIKQLLDAVEAEISEIEKEEQKHIKMVEKIRKKAQSRQEFLDEAVKVLIKSATKYFATRNDPTLTYNLFKPMCDRCGMKFEMKDVDTVRTNMLELGRKLYEIHMRRLKEGGQNE